MNSRGLDILNAVADLLSLPKITTLVRPDENTRKLLTLLNRTVRLLGDTYNWSSLRGESQIVTVAQKIDGTCTVTNGSAIITFADTTIDETRIGHAISFSSHPITYRITNVVSTTQATLNMEFLGETNTESSYTIAQDTYDLQADFSRPLGDWQSFFGPLNVTPVDPDEFADLRKLAGGMTVGEPTVFTIWGYADNGAPQVHLHPFPSEARMLGYAYHRVHPKITQDSDQVRFPVTKEEIIISAMVECWQRNLNDDARADGFLSDFIRKHNQVLVTETNATRRRPQITMNNDGFAVETAKWGRYGTDVDWGSVFDLAGFRIPR